MYVSVCSSFAVLLFTFLGLFVMNFCFSGGLGVGGGGVRHVCPPVFYVCLPPYLPRLCFFVPFLIFLFLSSVPSFSLSVCLSVNKSCFH